VILDIYPVGSGAFSLHSENKDDHCIRPGRIEKMGLIGVTDIVRLEKRQTSAAVRRGLEQTHYPKGGGGGKGKAKLIFTRLTAEFDPAEGKNVFLTQKADQLRVSPGDRAGRKRDQLGDLKVR